jgi:hypothetical protein
MVAIKYFDINILLNVLQTPEDQSFELGYDRLHTTEVLSQRCDACFSFLPLQT